MKQIASVTCPSCNAGQQPGVDAANLGGTWARSKAQQVYCSKFQIQMCWYQCSVLNLSTLEIATRGPARILSSLRAAFPFSQLCPCNAAGRGWRRQGWHPCETRQVRKPYSTIASAIFSLTLHQWIYIVILTMFHFKFNVPTPIFHEGLYTKP